MDDNLIRQYFAQPNEVNHRRYLALRAVFFDGRSQKDAAEEFGFPYHAFRQMIYEFRRSFGAVSESNVSPFFTRQDAEAAQRLRRMTIRHR